MYNASTEGVARKAFLRKKPLEDAYRQGARRLTR
jgi:hypothetical protein